MSLLKPPVPANLTCSVTYRDEAVYADAMAHLAERFGAVDATSDAYDFSSISDHYDAEMGGPLVKRIVSFERLLSRERFTAAKLFSVGIEDHFSVDGKRRINLDPGLLTMENFLLSTGKNHSHRIYLGEGVWAEVTLLFTKHATVQELPWTYRDYLRDPAASFLLSLRGIYKKKLTAL